MQSTPTCWLRSTSSEKVSARSKQAFNASTSSEHCFRTWQLTEACDFYLGHVSNESGKLITTLNYALLVILLTDVSVGTKVTGCVGERASRRSLPAKF